MFSSRRSSSAGAGDRARSTASGRAARPARPGRASRPCASADARQQVDEGLVGLARLRRRTAGGGRGSPSASKVGRLVDRAGEEALPSGLKGTKPMPSSSSVGRTSASGLARPQRVLALHRGHRLHGVRAADRLRARLGQAEVPHLARRDQVLDGAGDVLDRHVRVDAVLVEEVDARRSGAARSEASATSLMCSGRLLRPPGRRPPVRARSRTWWRSRPGRGTAPAPRRRAPRCVKGP